MSYLTLLKNCIVQTSTALIASLHVLHPQGFHEKWLVQKTLQYTTGKAAFLIPGGNNILTQTLLFSLLDHWTCTAVVIAVQAKQELRLVGCACSALARHACTNSVVTELTSTWITFCINFNGLSLLCHSQPGPVLVSSWSLLLVHLRNCRCLMI